MKKSGKIENFCVRPVLQYCSEIWVMAVTKLKRIGGVERRMIGLGGLKLVLLLVANADLPKKPGAEREKDTA